MHFIFLYPFLATFLLAVEIKDSIKERKYKKQWEKDAPIREAEHKKRCEMEAAAREVQERTRHEAAIEREEQWKKDAPMREKRRQKEERERKEKIRLLKLAEADGSQVCYNCLSIDRGWCNCGYCSCSCECSSSSDD